MGTPKVFPKKMTWTGVTARSTKSDDRTAGPIPDLNQLRYSPVGCAIDNGGCTGLGAQCPEAANPVSVYSAAKMAIAHLLSRAEQAGARAVLHEKDKSKIVSEKLRK